MRTKIIFMGSEEILLLNQPYESDVIYVFYYIVRTIDAVSSFKISAINLRQT